MSYFAKSEKLVDDCILLFSKGSTIGVKMSPFLTCYEFILFFDLLANLLLLHLAAETTGAIGQSPLAEQSSIRIRDRLGLAG